MQTLFTLAGGLALFLYGMDRLTAGLRESAGEGLRSLLRRAAGHPFRGLGIGTLLGVIAQTSAGTVLVAGFVHAGLLTLAQSLPLTLGLNIGTTLALQLIAFRLADLAPATIAAGTILYLTGAHCRRRPIGSALIGFGLLFLGMAMMGEALRPHRGAMAPWLAHFDGATPLGLLTGILAATAVTAVIQSSSATLGILFAMIHAGTIHRFEQAYPIVIGANIGTCITALLGTLGSNREAKRAAYSHLLFNVFGGLVGAAAAPLFYRWIGATSDSLVRQVAHANTIKMVATVALVWPWQATFLKLVRVVVVSREPTPPSSRLDPNLLAQPEDALRATLEELRRAAAWCRESHELTQRIILESTPAAWRRVQRNEAAVDQIKQAARNYLVRMTRYYLSRRQALLLQHLDRIAWNLERVHDHIKVIAALSIQRYNVAEARFFVEELDHLFELHEMTGVVLQRLEAALAPEIEDFGTAASTVIQARDALAARSSTVRAAFSSQVGLHRYPPLSGLFFFEYAVTFERLANHARQIAETLQEPYFRFKPAKFGRTAPMAPPFRPPDLVDVPAYLAGRPRRDRPTHETDIKKEHCTP